MKENRNIMFKLVSVMLAVCLVLSGNVPMLVNAVETDPSYTITTEQTPSEPEIPVPSIPVEPEIPESTAPVDPSLPEEPTPSVPVEPEIPEEPEYPVAPTLEHIRIEQIGIGQDIVFNAVVSDDIAVTYVRLFYRAVGTDSWYTAEMSTRGNDTYTAAITSSLVSPRGMEYYLEASDGEHIVREGSQEEPIVIVVKRNMAIATVSPRKVDIARVDDGIPAILNGSNFIEGMILTIGQQQVSYELLSTTTLRFTLPENNMGKYDITISYEGESYTMPNALTYSENESMVKVSVAGTVYGGSKVHIPVSISSSGGILGVDAQLQLDPDVFTNVTFQLGENNPSAMADCTVSPDGIVRISIASAEALDTTAPIGTLVANIASVKEETAYTIDVLSAMFNAVDVGMCLGCTVQVHPTYNITGVITYYGSGQGIPGVKVTLSTGQVTYTNDNGIYSFTGLHNKDVTVTASYSAPINHAISAQDAALVLQAASSEGQILSAMQTLAADVDGDGKLTAMDAVLILKRDVGNINAFPGASQEWILVASGENGWNFSGILLGDVTGNWSSTPPEELE